MATRRLPRRWSRRTSRGLLNFFYDECAAAIWRQDGLLNKVIGDAVLAIFNFPIRHADHAWKALAAARDIQERCTERCRREFAGYGLDKSELGLGIGIDSGLTTFGEFGHAIRTSRLLEAWSTLPPACSRSQPPVKSL